MSTDDKNKKDTESDLGLADEETKKPRVDPTLLTSWFLVVIWVLLTICLYKWLIYREKLATESISNLTIQARQAPRDCLEIQLMAVSPGQSPDQFGGLESFSRQIISPLDPLKKEVLCDFETGGGGWTIIQQRQPGGPHDLFNQAWKDYEEGFGVESSFGQDLNLNSSSNYWLGLKAIRALTMDPHALRIELTDWRGEIRFAEYDEFEVWSSEQSYRLWVSGYTGDAGDSLEYHSGGSFSTPDMDNDGNNDVHCAKSWHSGWWFKYCAEANLNGPYRAIDGQGQVGQNERIEKGDAITWNAWRGPYYSLKSVQMKIRPAFFHTKAKEMQEEIGRIHRALTSLLMGDFIFILIALVTSFVKYYQLDEF